MRRLTNVSAMPLVAAMWFAAAPACAQTHATNAAQAYPVKAVRIITGGAGYKASWRR